MKHLHHPPVYFLATTLVGYGIGTWINLPLHFPESIRVFQAGIAPRCAVAVVDTPQMLCAQGGTTAASAIWRKLSTFLEADTTMAIME
jgi:hypothetical protein